MLDAIAAATSAKRRVSAWIALLTLALTVMPAADARRTQPIANRPGVWLTWDSFASVNDHAVIPWKWSKRSGLNATDTLKIQHRRKGTTRWNTIATGVPITERRYEWDTSNINPGRVVRHELRLIVQGTNRRTTPFPFWIDHIPPTVEITHPLAKPIELPGGDETEPVAVVTGPTALQMLTTDRPRKPTAIFRDRRWRVTGPIWTIESGPNTVYDFSNPPGIYTIWAIAEDRAGNRTMSAPMRILGLPALPD